MSMNFAGVERNTKDRLLADQRQLTRTGRLIRPRRLIVYALDSSSLSDDLHGRLREHLARLNGEQLAEWYRDHPCLAALHFIRRFFEESDGYAYQNLLDLGGKLTRQRVAQLFGIWQDKGLLDRLQVPGHPDIFVPLIRCECWCVRAGTGSELWDTLIPVIHGLPGLPTLAAFREAAPRLLKEALRENEILPVLRLGGMTPDRTYADPDFLEFLYYLKRGVLDGAPDWLRAPIAAWSEREAINGCDSVAWVADHNGGHVKLVVTNLVFRHGRPQLSLEHRDVVTECVLDPKGGRQVAGGTRDILFPRLEFSPLQMGMQSLDGELTIRFGNGRAESRELPSLDDPMLFRGTADGFQAIGADRQAYCCRVLVLLRHPLDPQSATFRWGGTTLQPYGQKCFTAEVLNADDMDSARTLRYTGVFLRIPVSQGVAPKPLVMMVAGREQELLQIGPRTKLELRNASPGLICSAAGDDTPCPVVVGTEAVLSLSEDALDQDLLKNVERSGGASATFDATTGILVVPDLATGQMHTCRYSPSGATVSFTCVPEHVRELLYADHEVDRDGWRWQPQPPADAWHDHPGYTTGILMHGESRLTFSVPWTTPRSCWRLASVAEPEYSIQTRKFGDLDELARWQLLSWSLDGEGEAVSVGDATLPGPNNVHRFCELLHRWPAFGEVDQTVGIRLGQKEVGQVTIIPRHPVLYVGGDGKVNCWIPESVDPANLKVFLLREDRLLAPIAVLAPLRTYGTNPIAIDESRGALAHARSYLVLASTSVQVDGMTLSGLVQLQAQSIGWLDALQVTPGVRCRLVYRLLQMPEINGEGALDALRDLHLCLSTLWHFRAAQRLPEQLVSWLREAEQSLAVEVPPEDDQNHRDLELVLAQGIRGELPLETCDRLVATWLLPNDSLWALSPSFADVLVDRVRERIGRMTDSRRRQFWEWQPVFPALRYLHLGHPAASGLSEDQVKHLGLHLQGMGFGAFLPENRVSIYLPECGHDPERDSVVVVQKLGTLQRTPDLRIRCRWGVLQVQPPTDTAPWRVSFRGEWQSVGIHRVQTDERFAAFLTHPGERTDRRYPLLATRPYQQAIHDACSTEPLLPPSVMQAVDELFREALDSCVTLLGRTEDHRLASVLAHVSNRCGENCRRVAGYANRHLVWQVATICRLYAWCPETLRGALERHHMDRLLFRIGSDIHDSGARQLLFNDLIAVEWLIMWYKEFRWQGEHP